MVRNIMTTNLCTRNSSCEFTFWQALVSGDVMSVDKYPEIISSISTADVQAAAKKLAGSKLAMGAVGNLSSVPYIDAL